MRILFYWLAFGIFSSIAFQVNADVSEKRRVLCEQIFELTDTVTENCASLLSANQSTSDTGTSSVEDRIALLQTRYRALGRKDRLADSPLGTTTPVARTENTALSSLLENLTAALQGPSDVKAVPLEPLAEQTQLNANSLALIDTQSSGLIGFEQGGSRLNAHSLDTIKTTAKLLQIEPLAYTCIKLIGHSDSSGSEAVNYSIGLKRAQSVAVQMRALLDNPARIQQVVSLGETAPLKNIPSTLAANRRVEVWVSDC
ncbi:MAG: OmpA family protein [Pseudomonadota bacterium]